MKIKELREKITEAYEDSIRHGNSINGTIVTYNKSKGKVYAHLYYVGNILKNECTIAIFKNQDLNELDFLQNSLHKEIEYIINKNDEYLEFPYPEKIKNFIIKAWNSDKSFYDDIEEFTESTDVYEDSGLKNYILDEYIKELMDIFKDKALSAITEKALMVIDNIDKGLDYEPIDCNDENLYC